MGSNRQPSAYTTKCINEHGFTQLPFQLNSSSISRDGSGYNFMTTSSHSIELITSVLTQARMIEKVSGRSILPK